MKRIQKIINPVGLKEAGLGVLQEVGGSGGAVLGKGSPPKRFYAQTSQNNKTA